MAPLEGDTLGRKHRHYNILVDEALKSNQPLKPIDESEDDIQNLIKIEVACKNRNVEYILEILKSEDQLYVSKAIKRSTWLFTDPQYAHIINPEYLYTQLYPQMTSKAFNKLILNIRLHLRDEKRVEFFYEYIKEKDVKSAQKWLQHCSLAFVEKEVANSKHDISMKLLLRLFKKSFSVYETNIRSQDYYYFSYEPKFIANRYPEKLLDFLESLKGGIHYRFDHKETKTLMEKCPEKVLQKFHLFGKCLHLATFAKLLKKIQDIEDFLLQHAENKTLTWLYAFDKIQHFIKQMRKESRFTFVKKIFIDKETFDNADENQKYQNIANRVAEHLYNIRTQHTNIYMWYKFAPFEIADFELKKLIRAESVPLLRSSMLQVLLTCAGRNEQHIQTVLQYFHDNHINEPFKFKIQFVNAFISKVNTHTLDEQSWEMLNKLFHSMEVFIKSENNVQSCIKAIIVRSAIRHEQVPDIIKTKFVFDTLKETQITLKQHEKDRVFEYLRDFIITKSNYLNLTVENEFNEAVTFCEHLLHLLKDWKKELRDDPYTVNRIKELIKIKKETRWSRDITKFYNLKKSWRKEMFEESIYILPTEEVCMNALKHDPNLLTRNMEQVLTMTRNDALSLRNLLRKIRIYWPHTLAEDWRNMYLKRLDQPGSHKSLIVGLSTLLTNKAINDLLEKYAPSENKINWNESDELELSLRKQIAKNIHKARPPPSVEVVLLYAKGDYLQYAIPSLNAVLSQLSPNKSRLYIPILLNSPVSLQKFGLRCAIRKLPFEELKELLSEIWNTTKKSSIRTVLFTQTFQMLCRNSSDIKNTWTLLSMFIDKLTKNDNRLLFKKLGEVYKVPENIKPKFYMKGYTFLSSLPAKFNCDGILLSIDYMALDFMEYLDDDFVPKIMLKNFKNLITADSHISNNRERIIASFILASVDEDTQIRRYEKSIDIILEQCLAQWETISEDKYHVKQFIVGILQKLVINMENYTIGKNLHIPVKVFERIQLKLENKLSLKKNYVLLRSWKLAATFVKLLNENKHVLENFVPKTGFKVTDDDKSKMYTMIHELVAPPFSRICVQYLKEDMTQIGPSVYSLFSKTLKLFFDEYLWYICQNENKLLYLKCLLQCENDREAYLMVHGILVREMTIYDNYNPKEKQMLKIIYDLVMLNCSDEIKIHFHDAFVRTAFPDSDHI